MRYPKQLDLFIVCKKCKQILPSYLKRRSNKECILCLGGIEKNAHYFFINKFAKVVRPDFLKHIYEEKKIKHLFKRGIRARLRDFLKSKGIKKKVNKWIGCDLPTFKAHIESKWKPEMTWENYGLYGWHIDHIKPLSKFDLTSDEEIAKINHYTNLQPLWAKDNLNKSNIYE